MNAGAIPGLDITPEAALAKLAHVLSLPIRWFFSPGNHLRNLPPTFPSLQSKRAKGVDGEEYERRDVS